MTERDREPLLASTPAIDGFQVVLLRLADSMQRSWQAILEQYTPSDLHDLRVAARRSRVVLSASKRVLPDGVAVAARDQMAWMGSITGPVRDLDVLAAQWEQVLEGADRSMQLEIEPVRQAITDRRDRERAALLKALRSGDRAALLPQWRHTLERVATHDSQGRDAEVPLGTVVARRLKRAHKLVLLGGRRLDENTPAEAIHQLRKDAKRLRYVFRCFADLIEKEAGTEALATFTSHLSRVQDSLGAHQDAEVQLQVVRALVRDGAVPEVTERVVHDLVEQLEGRRAEARGAFAAQFTGFDAPEVHAEMHELLRRLGSGPAK